MPDPGGDAAADRGAAEAQSAAEVSRYQQIEVEGAALGCGMAFEYK